MRKRLLIVVGCCVLLYLAFWHVPWFPGFVHAASPYGRLFFSLVFVLLLGPGILTILAWFRFVLGSSGGPFDGSDFGTAEWLVVSGLISWLFWFFALPRLLKIVGLWNPFSYRVDRPWFLQALIQVRDWWEILTRFGRQATGGWAGLIEVLSQRWRIGDVFLGRPRLKIGAGLLRPVGIPTEKHMVTLAGTGSGKSTAALIPNLCIHPGSLLCIDPKGELAMITASRRGQGGHGVRGMGQETFVLDPFGITGHRTASYNVFDEMARIAERDINAPPSYANKIAEAIVEIQSRDPFWDTAARRYIAGIILYVFQGPAGRRNLVQVRRLLVEGDKDAFEEGRRQGFIDGRKNTAQDALLIGMSHVQPGPYRDMIAGAAASIMAMPANQQGSVVTIAQEHTAFLDVPEIRNVSMTTDFLLQDLKLRPISVYLSVPINMVTGVAGRWLKMFVLLLVDVMIRVNVKVKYPVLLAIDEFPNLGRLEGIELIAPLMRSYGMRFWAVGQDIQQFKRTYPDSWGGFIGGAEAVQFMGVKEIETVQLIVDFLGRHVFQTQEGQGKMRRTVAQERNLLDTNQVSRLLLNSRKNQIVWRGDRRPMVLKTAPYFEYMPYWYYDADPRYREKFIRAFWRVGRGKRPLGPALHPPPAPSYLDYYPQQAKPAPPAGGDPFALFDENVRRKKKGLPPLERRPVVKNPPAKKPEKDAPDLLSFLKPFPPLPPDADADLREQWFRKVGDPPLKKRPVIPPEIANILKPPPEAKADPMAELDAMIGLDTVKAQVRRTLSLVKLSDARKNAGMPHLDVTHHLVFTGNPGTGKTTVARIIGRVYRDRGLLKRGHLIEADRGDLVASFIGQTAPKVKEVVEKALGGVLFIDEAYGLVNDQGAGDQYGAEAVQTLLKLMEDKRGELVVIAAGYRVEMAKFIAANPGLASRFKTFIEFPDYDPLELMEILLGMVEAASCRMSKDALARAAEVLVRLSPGHGFGNGRVVRNLFEECIARQAVRLQRGQAYGAVDLQMIEADDVPEDFAG